MNPGPGLFLIAVASTAVAAGESTAVHSQSISAEQVAALMEFVGSWQQTDGQWVDAMSLDAEDAHAQDGDTANDEQDDDEK